MKLVSCFLSKLSRQFYSHILKLSLYQKLAFSNIPLEIVSILGINYRKLPLHRHRCYILVFKVVVLICYRYFCS